MCEKVWFPKYNHIQYYEDMLVLINTYQRMTAVLYDKFTPIDVIQNVDNITQNLFGMRAIQKPSYWQYKLLHQ